MKKTEETKNTNRTFEDSLKKVEEIATMLEDGNLPLRKRVEKFEEGISLLRYCENELDEVELIIQKVIDKNDDEIRLEKIR